MDFQKTLEDLFAHEAPSEVLFNSYDSHWVEKQGQLYQAPSCFSNSHDYHRFIDQLCESIDQPLTLEKPFVEARVQNYRLSVVSRELTKKDHVLSLRRIQSESWDLEYLVQSRWCTSEQMTIIKNIIQNKKNFLVIGATGSGKTTLMNSFIKIIPERERVITIEDTDELHLNSDSGLKLLTRSSQNAILTEYTQSDLLKRALRLRPDRLIVGEVRGNEAKDLLLVLSTGHAGSFSSLHAENALQALTRLEMLVQMGAPQWNLYTVRRLIHCSLQYLISVERLPNGHRQLRSLSRISSLEDHGFCLDEII